jgi:hypothetical protein
MQSSDSHDASCIETQRHFVRAMSKSIDGQPLSETERTLLDELFEALLRGEDVSKLTGVRRPHTRRSTDRVYVALHYLCLTRLMGTPPETAWRVVSAAWGVTKRDARWLIAQSREPALSALGRFSGAPDRLLRACEQRARGMRPGAARAQESTPTDEQADDALILMLSRLCEPRATDTH